MCSIDFDSSDARISCEHETKTKLFYGVIQKYYEIHAINQSKAIGQYIFFWVGNNIESNVRLMGVRVALKWPEKH